MQSQSMDSMLSASSWSASIHNAPADVVNQVAMQQNLSEEEVQILFSQVRGDDNRYFQVILNLLSNALKFTGVGKEVQVKLTVTDVQ